MPKYGYNYPWSGRLGRLTDRCLYYGDDGPQFQASSRAGSCLQCRPGTQEPRPDLLAAHHAAYDKQARAWCFARGIDFDATVANYERHLGPPLQERDGPIPGATQNLTVYVKDRRTTPLPPED